MGTYTLLCIPIGTDKPTLKLLSKYVKPIIAPQWRDLGVQLLLDKSTPKLNIIEKDNSKDIEACCREMFEYWLGVDEGASWNKLINALEEIGQNALAASIKQNVLKGNFIGYCSYVATYFDMLFSLNIW